MRENLQAWDASACVIMEEGNPPVSGAESPQKFLIHVIRFDEETDQYQDVIAIPREAPLGRAGERETPRIAGKEKWLQGMKARDPIVNGQHRNTDHVLKSSWMMDIMPV